MASSITIVTQVVHLLHVINVYEHDAGLFWEIEFTEFLLNWCVGGLHTFDRRFVCRMVAAGLQDSFIHHAA